MGGKDKNKLQFEDRGPLSPPPEKRSSFYDNFGGKQTPPSLVSPNPPSVSKPNLSANISVQGESSRTPPLNFPHVTPRPFAEVMRELRKPMDEESSTEEHEETNAEQWMEDKNHFMEKSFRSEKDAKHGRTVDDNIPEIEGVPRPIRTWAERLEEDRDDYSPETYARLREMHLKMEELIEESNKKKAKRDSKKGTRKGKGKK